MATFSVSIDPIKAQAIDFANIPILYPTYIASVHLEDSDDDLFWDALIQDVKPGKYNYIYHSRAKSGKTSSGCTQCRQYLPYISKYFFICIDSDFNLLKEDTAKHHTAADFVAQTHAYSWENHLCEKKTLNGRYQMKYTTPFNFIDFLRALSKELYPLLVVYLSVQKGVGGLNLTQINNAVSTTCSKDEIQYNGAGYITKIHNGISHFITPYLASVNLSAEKAYYSAKGLNEDNAYLHWQGHHLFNIIANVGKALCGNREEFIYDVLMTSFPISGYPELNSAHRDLEIILNDYPQVVK